MEMEKELIYLYCVADKAPDLKKVREWFEKPKVIRHEGLYAVVGRVPRGDFDEENLKKNLGDMDWVKERVISHEQVLEAAMADSCVVPFKFATLFNSEGNLKRMLARNAPLLKEALRKLEGHEEWGVKIYCGLDALRATLAQDKEILDKEKEIGSSSPGKAFILRKKQEERLNQMLNAKINECGHASFDRLRELCAGARINRLLPEEVTEKKEEMILNAAFLISRNAVQAFMEAVDALKARHGDNGLSFDCTGPWPPYNFCDFAGRMEIRSAGTCGTSDTAGAERTADHGRA